VITDARVSWHHAALRTEDGRWVLVDNGSTNGTYTGGRRVSRIEITGEIVARLGHPTDGPVLTCTVAATGRGKQGAPSVHLGPGTVEEGATALLPAPRPAPEPAPAPPPSRTLRIGRSPDNDIVVLDPDVSRHHAELRGTAGAYRIVDLASANGTFVNGQRGTDVPLSEGDVVRIGSASFRLAGQELQKITESGAGTGRPPPP
jgi:pSer/pThr/pTyr-binding forkhead associated (FHA) protein